MELVTPEDREGTSMGPRSHAERGCFPATNQHLRRDGTRAVGEKAGAQAGLEARLCWVPAGCTEATRPAVPGDNRGHSASCGNERTGSTLCLQRSAGCRVLQDASPVLVSCTEPPRSTQHGAGSEPPGLCRAAAQTGRESAPLLLLLPLPCVPTPTAVGHGQHPTAQGEIGWQPLS